MLKILVIDDSATARMMIGKCLEMTVEGELQIIEASNGEQALSLMKSEPPNLILSDLNMPKMDGNAILKSVKCSPRLNDLPVIIITSAGNPKREEELTANGAELVLKKPVTPPLLSNAIDQLKERGVITL